VQLGATSTDELSLPLNGGYRGRCQPALISFSRSCGVFHASLNSDRRAQYSVKKRQLPKISREKCSKPFEATKLPCLVNTVAALYDHEATLGTFGLSEHKKAPQATSTYRMIDLSSTPFLAQSGDIGVPRMSWTDKII
jgi:hypothetical protein